MKASLPKDLTPIGATTLLFGISSSCAVFLSIGQAVCASRLETNLATIVSGEVVQKVIAVDATSVRSVVSATELPGVLYAYSYAITQVFVCGLDPVPLQADPIQYIPAIAPVISFFLLLGCKWTTVKKAKAEETGGEVDSEAIVGTKGT